MTNTKHPWTNGQVERMPRTLGEATEHIAEHAGEGIGGLLNATFGNAAELIIAIVALRAGFVDVVKAALTGSIIGNILLVLGAALAASVASTRWWSIGAKSLAFILLSGCLVMVLAYIYRSPRVTLDVMFGAVTAYLLIAFSFAALYSLALQLDPRNFRLPEWVELEAVEAVRIEMIYFSLVTLATLGYGDILPSAPFTQMLAVLEAMIGQFFMAVLVSWLVGMFIYDNFAGDR